MSDETPTISGRKGLFGLSFGLTAGIGCCVLPAVLLLVFGLIGFGYFNGIHNDGVKQETTLTAEYQSAQNELSAQTLKMKDALGIAQLKSDSIDKILSDAVVGRYNAPSSPQPDSGKLFSAIHEAYPQVDAGAFDKAMDIMTAGREAFKNKQNALLDKIRAFDAWRKTGLFKSQMVSMMGVPDDTLEARIGADVKTGQAALDRMKLIVLDGDTNAAYSTGTQAPLVPPTTKK